jgi:hypothetical protein
MQYEQNILWAADGLIIINYGWLRGRGWAVAGVAVVGCAISLQRGHTIPSLSVPRPEIAPHLRMRRTEHRARRLPRPPPYQLSVLWSRWHSRRRQDADNQNHFVLPILATHGR